MKREKVYGCVSGENGSDILREKSQVRVEALAEELKVSVITIRRDLQTGRAEAADPGIRRCSCILEQGSRRTKSMQMDGLRAMRPVW